MKKVAMSDMTKQWSLKVLLLLTVVSGFIATRAQAATIGVDWTSATAGTLSGNSVTMSGITAYGQGTGDLSGAPFGAAPLSATQEIINYGANDDWTVTFGSPVSNLLLYMDYWRGGLSDVGPATYTFDAGFTAYTAGNLDDITTATPSITATTFGHGILKFAGPLSSLAISAPTLNDSVVTLTFGVEETAAAVPEPSTFALAGLGLVGLGLLAWRRRK